MHSKSRRLCSTWRGKTMPMTKRNYKSNRSGAGDVLTRGHRYQQILCPRACPWYSACSNPLPEDSRAQKALPNHEESNDLGRE
eukprot:scaffold266498_cov30-Tisochrysis_lutea.AAC.2